ncbi:MAG: hypothetical protein ABUK01_11640 [Leptospirales bacterium]
MKGFIVSLNRFFQYIIVTGTVFIFFTTATQAKGLTPFQATGADILGWEFQVIGHETLHTLLPM